MKTAKEIVEAVREEDFKVLNTLLKSLEETSELMFERRVLRMQIYPEASQYSILKNPPERLVEWFNTNGFKIESESSPASVCKRYFLTCVVCE